MPSIKKKGNIVRIFTLKGGANYNLRNYRESAENYTKVIEAETYKFSSVKRNRGISRYYDGDMEGALKDFIDMKKIILNFFENQNKTKYKYRNPPYTEKDLEDINNWIENVK